MNTEPYDRAQDVKNFDAAKTGVKGLVDSGITTIPRFFIHPPNTLSNLRRLVSDYEVIPTIDLCGVASGSEIRSTVVEKIALASRQLGFFQVVNHGIEVEALERVIGAIKAFHEQPSEIKSRFYRREMTTGVSFFSNFDLFRSKAASWRDTLQVLLGVAIPDEIPEMCGKEVVEWNNHVNQLGELLMGLLCEGLGVETGRLKEMTFLEGKVMVAHCYPYCPQPDPTVGFTSHTDSGVLTILLQDHVGGLQIKTGEEWVDVKPVPGALVINVGDLLQHRVLANPSHEPRISIGVSLHPSKKESLYGPLPEIISPKKPARFRQFTYTDYIRRFFSKEFDSKSLANYYRLIDTQ